MAGQQLEDSVRLRALAPVAVRSEGSRPCWQWGMGDGGWGTGAGGLRDLARPWPLGGGGANRGLKAPPSWSTMVRDGWGASQGPVHMRGCGRSCLGERRVGTHTGLGARARSPVASRHSLATTGQRVPRQHAKRGRLPCSLHSHRPETPRVPRRRHSARSQLPAPLSLIPGWGSKFLQDGRGKGAPRGQIPRPSR